MITVVQHPTSWTVIRHPGWLGRLLGRSTVRIEVRRRYRGETLVYDSSGREVERWIRRAIEHQPVNLPSARALP